MKDFWQTNHMDGLGRRLQAANRVVLFINYDRVLIPASSSSILPALDPHTRERMRELSEKDHLTLVLVTNHAMQSFKKMVGFSGIYLVANNGMEIYGPDMNVIHAEAKRVRKQLEPIVAKLTPRLRELEGVRLEDRNFSLAIHFSKADARNQKQARGLLEEIWTPVMDTFVLEEENQQWVLRPRMGWGKSRAVLFVWNKFSSPRKRPLVLYLGAEEGDEEIFSQMGKEGVGLLVGKGRENSSAAFQLKNREEANRFFDWLVQHLPAGPLTRSKI